MPKLKSEDVAKPTVKIAKKRTVKKSTTKKVAEKPTKKLSDLPETKTKILEVRGEGKVYVEKGVTKNMGDYNSARVTVGITLPLEPTDQEIADAVKTITIASDLLDAELEKQVADLLT